MGVRRIAALGLAFALALQMGAAKAAAPESYTVTLSSEQLAYIAAWLRGDSAICSPPWNKANPIINALGQQVDRALAAKSQAEREAIKAELEHAAASTQPSESPGK